MQLIEILLIAILTIGYLGKSFFKHQQAKKLTFGILMTFVICHFLFEGARWQMIPVYFSIPILSIYLFTAIRKKWLRFIIVSFGLIILIIGGTLSYLLPVFELAKPTGKYTVGTKEIYLEDTSRLETITDEPADFRKITVKIYYPSTSKLKNPEKYLGNGIAEAFANSKGIPAFAFSHFNLISTNTEKDLPMIEKSFPVIILSHGYLWNVELYPTIIEGLVSQGFIVAGIQHSYEAPIVRWKEDSFYPIQTYFNQVNERMDYEKFGQLEQEFKATEQPDEKFKLMQQMMQMLPYNESIERWQKDISFTITELSKLNQSEIWKNQFDLDKIGVLGHSFGGAAAAEATAFDTRIKAGVNLDGAQWGQLIDTTLNIPFMAMYADRNYEEFFSPNFYIFNQATQTDFYQVIIKNTGHANYGSLGYWTSLHQFTETGSINPTKMSNYTSTLLLAFFDKFLNKKSINLEGLGLPKTEVLIEKLN